MKRITAVLLLAALLIACLNGCGLMLASFETGEEIMDAVLSALQEQDKEALRGLFSEYTLSETKGFDRTIEDLFAYYQGKVVSVHDWGTHTSEERDEDMRKHDLYLSYDITTSDQVYRFAVHYCAMNDYAPEQEGICSLYIIKMEEDTDPQRAYRGGHIYAPGIYIGIPDAPLDEEDRTEG